MQRRPLVTLAVLGTTLALVAGACGYGGSSQGSQSKSSAGGSNNAASSGNAVNVGIATVQSGSVAEIGQTGVQGVRMAVQDLNAKGGLLGKKIHLVTADSHADASTGANEVRNMVQNDHIVADFGAVSSAVGVAEEAVTSSHHVPFIGFTDNDVTLMTTHGNKWSFQVVPNTYMEPRAVAYYVKQKYGSKPIRVATITPNYNFGLSEVSNFLAGLKEYHVNATIVTQQKPKLGETNFDSYISAILAKNPTFVFGGIYGGDLVTFTKQAAGFGLFKKVKMAAQYNRAQLQALGSSNPAAGGVGFDRAAFWAMKNLDKSWVNRFHKEYNNWPTAWAVLGYSAVQTWAYAVKKAGSFGGTKVAGTLPGATVQTIRGPITIRACDHQALVPEYVGPISNKVNPAYGFPTYVKAQTQVVSAKKIIDPCGYKPSS
ncbi:MAG TPA: ABC transporter substrate-binding protein [Acidimicrobiales bacterium]|nr:ABC transporter substrate-binding protein [Acidimicrobiales bacterium]